MIGRPDPEENQYLNVALRSAMAQTEPEPACAVLAAQMAPAEAKPAAVDLPEP